MKSTVKKVLIKRQLREWEKAFANDETNKGSISKIYKQFIQLKTFLKKLKKWADPEINPHHSS